VRAFAFPWLLVALAAACQAGPPADTHWAASPTIPTEPTSSSSTSSPTAARTFSVDEGLVEAHESACQAVNSEVLYADPPPGGAVPTAPPRHASAVPSGWRTLIDRLPRVAVSQSNGIPVHVYADDERYVFCFSLGGRVHLQDGEFAQRGEGLVVPLGGLNFRSGANSVNAWFGSADPVVAWVAATVPDVGVVEAPVVDGLFVLAWPGNASDDDGRVERYDAYDRCGNHILEIDVAGQATPCAAQP